jgi:hypothetical protein
MATRTVHYGSVPHQRAHVSRLAHEIARELHCQPRTADAYLNGCQPTREQFAGILRACVRLGDRQSIEREMRPVEAALSALPPARFSADIVIAFSRADAAEEVTRTAALLDGMTAEERLAWLRRLDDLIPAALALRRALETFR